MGIRPKAGVKKIICLRKGRPKNRAIAVQVF